MKRKNIAIAGMIISVAGFVFVTNLKSNFRTFTERIFTNAAFQYSLNTSGGNTYLISLWGVDEETGLQQWAEMEFSYELKNTKGEVFEADTIRSFKSEENGGIRRASNGTDITFNPNSNGEWILTGHFTNGDYLDVEFYENLPSNLYWFPVLFIGLFLFSLVVYIRNRQA